jgi:CBS domain-containing protein
VAGCRLAWPQSEVNEAVPEVRRDAAARAEEATMRTQVKDMMTVAPATCRSDDDLAAAASRMWETDCGMLPVVDDGSLVGVITDRDICMGVALSGRRAPEIRVSEVASRGVWTCLPEDQVVDALAAMARHQVRRLPVLDNDRLVGVLAINDVVICAGEDPTLRQPILDALERICAHRSLPAVSA